MRFRVGRTQIWISFAVVALLLIWQTRWSASSQRMTWSPKMASDDPLASCPGYSAKNVQRTHSGLTADLMLAGPACDVYGDDLQFLKLTVEYQTESRLHVKIQDAENHVYQVPESVFPRPIGSFGSHESDLEFIYQTSPFAFKVSRKTTGEVLFDTSGASLVFESQYLRLRTKLPENPNIYGLGEHSDSFKLKTDNYIRTLWNRDSFGIPPETNLYGAHPVYVDHRAGGTHGVLFLNSNGMDVKISKSRAEGQYLEFNALGGILDFYFLAGPTPVEVSQQYALVAGLPAMVSYWTFGFHNCRYGYQDAYEVAEVVLNYSRAAIPLETMWIDIDYMNLRKVFSLDPQRFPLSMMQELVHFLHDHDQHFVLMVDPAVAYQPAEATYKRGVTDDIWLKGADGSDWKGVVWPGVTVFPDWFSSKIQSYWNNEFNIFFSPETGVDIDGLWIDMNEPSNFACEFPCNDPFGSAKRRGFPPAPPPLRTPPRPLSGFSCSFQPENTPCNGTTAKQVPGIAEPERLSPEAGEVSDQAIGEQLGLPGRDLIRPKYAIHNAEASSVDSNAAGGGLSTHIVNTDVIHQNSLTMYDTHNLYGTRHILRDLVMSTASRTAMLQRRPRVRPLVITRSTFAGAGAKVGHWLGDNYSRWTHYRISIPTMMGFASIYQVPMVGSDVCGYGEHTNEQLCARWAMLGAFSPFYRNHNMLAPAISQEFYRWPLVTKAAKKAIDVRYRLLDYIYTAFYLQTQDGTPLINPMFYLYPSDVATFGIDMQYFYGPALLISPVTEEDATSVGVYLPKDIFYDFWTFKRVEGTGEVITITNQSITDIPLHIRGGNIIPMRTESTMTLAEQRTKDFELIVAPGSDGGATGELYLDDGDSLEQSGTTFVRFTFNENVLVMTGLYGFKTDVKIVKITFLGTAGKLRECKINERGFYLQFDAWSEAAVLGVVESLSADFKIECT